VGQFPANAFGLHDMHGNLWEWVQDVWHDNYAGAPSDGSAWMSGGDPARRVLRGGSWSIAPQFLRSAYRNRNAPDGRNFITGFRIARTF
jgi:formylglycine-generating enzyme required for sulfatase activity